MFHRLIWHSDRVLLDDLVFRLEHYKRADWDGGHEYFMFYKTQALVEQYRRFWSDKDFRPRHLVELGIWDGGSTAFWFELFQPSRHIAIDIAHRTDSTYFQRYLETRGLQDRIRTYWGIDQADSARLRQLVEKEFDAPLDLVIDDASHLYRATRSSFETLFPLLRPGGLYIIEDWAWEHWAEFHSPAHPWASETSLTRLISELIEATGSSPALIASLAVFQGFTAIERGEIELSGAEQFDLASHISSRPSVGARPSPSPIPGSRAIRDQEPTQAQGNPALDRLVGSTPGAPPVQRSACGEAHEAACGAILVSDEGAGLEGETLPDASRYDVEIDVNSDSTHAKVVRLVGTDRDVLELGCATGHMSRVLRDRGCRVVGVEIDQHAATLAAPFCERVIVGDLDRLDLGGELGDKRFDVLVAADVLEHLKNPTRILASLREHLQPDGYVVASIPNVAHGSVRLALLGGSFPYAERGLLDRTHLRFYTHDTMVQLFEDAGYTIGWIERQEKPFELSEVPYSRAAAPEGVPDQLAADREALTYHFIVVAYPMPHPDLQFIGQCARRLTEERDAAEEQVRGLTDERDVAEQSARRLVEERDATQHELVRVRDVVKEQRGQLDALTARIESGISLERELRAMLADAQGQLVRRDEAILRLYAQTRESRPLAARVVESDGAIRTLRAVRLRLRHTWLGRLYRGLRGSLVGRGR